MTDYSFGGDTSNWVTIDNDNQNGYQYISSSSFSGVGQSITSIKFTLQSNSGSVTVSCDIRNAAQAVIASAGSQSVGSASAIEYTFTLSSAHTLAVGEFIALRSTGSCRMYVCSSCTTSGTYAGYFASDTDDTQYNYDGNGGRPNRNVAGSVGSGGSTGTRLPPPPIVI